jgi:hypothetical protein
MNAAQRDVSLQGRMDCRMPAGRCVSDAGDRFNSKPAEAKGWAKCCKFQDGFNRQMVEMDEKKSAHSHRFVQENA